MRDCILQPVVGGRPHGQPPDKTSLTGSRFWGPQVDIIGGFYLRAIGANHDETFRSKTLNTFPILISDLLEATSCVIRDALRAETSAKHRH